MVMNISTNEISTDEWKSKIINADDEWLIKQFYGLSFLTQSLDNKIDKTFHGLNREKREILDDEYREYIYPLETELMDMEIQLVDVEDELERRGIALMLVE